MLEFFKNFYNTVHFMMNRQAVLDSLAAKSTELGKSSSPQPKITAGQDCVIKSGWAVVCCSPNCDPARCEALVAGNPHLTFAMFKSGTCKELGKPRCGGA
jgi:hypothetical protein